MTSVAADRSAEALNVTVRHDERTRIWFVGSSDLPGLHAEAATLDDLVEIIEDLAPELALNLAASSGPLPLPICIRHLVTLKPAHAA